ncbi:MAG: IS1595 family transposase [Pseudolabrys sp.]|nr:IS1595 family transposase [Pseudolabrys sp.]
MMNFDSLFDLMEAFPNEQACIDHLKEMRWGNEPFCPHCGGIRVYTFSDNQTFKCADCRSRFSIKVGTVFEDSKLPLRKWFMAIWLITNHPKGIASTTLAKDLKITQKTAWFVLHRLRHAARTRSFNATTKLTGKVEIDETYVGGKAKNRHGRRSGEDFPLKTVVIGAKERDGETVARIIPDASKSELQGFVKSVVSNKAEMLVTDAHPGYSRLEGYPQHQVVNHNKGEWRKGDAHTNSIESVWALLKRQIIGVHHWVSPKHLDRYVGEMTFRLNRRNLTVTERMNSLFGCVEGRLTYKALIA